MSYCHIVMAKNIARMTRMIHQCDNSIANCLLRISKTLGMTLQSESKIHLSSKRNIYVIPKCHTHARHFQALSGSIVRPVPRNSGSGARRHTSSLFVSDSSAQNTAPVELDLGLERRVTRVKELRRNLQIRGIQFDVDMFLEDFRLMKRLETEKNKLEREKEHVAKQVAALKKQQNTDEVRKLRESLIQRGKQIREALRELQLSWWVWEERVLLSALNLPNDIRTQTPEEQDIIIESFGELPDMSEARCHLDIAKEKDLIKFSSAGVQAYYLKGKLASLEQSLLQSVSTTLTNNNFHSMACPEIVRSLVAEGCGVDYKEKSKIFTLQDEDEANKPTSSKLDDFTHIQGVSLTSFAAYLAKTVVKTSDLPYRMYTVGRQYTPVPESDMPGLYGVSQSMKTAFLSACADRVSCVSEFNKGKTLIWNMYHRLNIHMRLVLVQGRQLHRCESMRAEIQMWAPSLKGFVRVGHVSCIDDYVSRRLMCYHSDNFSDYKTYQHVQMVYGEVLDVTRLMAVLLEHNVLDQTLSALKMEERQHI